MRIRTLIRLSLGHYWRTNLAVVVGVAVTATALGGALVVGESVRGSLRSLSLLRLGNTDYVIATDDFFRAALAEELQARQGFREQFQAATPLISLQGIVAHEASGRRATGVYVYGVDERFWRFHALSPDTQPDGNTLLLSPGLAQEFSAAAGDSILVRLQKPSAIPLDSLHGQRTNLTRSLRLRLARVLPREELGEFSLRPQQGTVRAVFVPLGQLQDDLEREDQVNTILVSRKEDSATGGTDQLRSLLAEGVSMEDLGIRLQALEERGALSLESERILLPDAFAEVARRVAQQQGLHVTAIFSYLANTIRAGEREIPYSMVTAMDPPPVEGEAAAGGDTTPPPVWLNQWAAGDLGIRVGDRVEMDYYVWEDEGRLVTRTAAFHLEGVLPMRGLGTDSTLAPDFPGVTDATTVAQWDPPFPVDLNRIRDKDEDYWDRYRAAPKAFLPLAVGQELWRSRYGQLTELRLEPPAGQSLAETLHVYRQGLQSELDPLQLGFAVHAVRAESLEASRGAVNFGEYFFYFSFFIVVSAILLTGLFFRLGIEQRLREIGLLRAVGFAPQKIRLLFAGEGLILAVIGCALGTAGAVAYGWLIMLGLRTWWVDAVGTTLLSLHLSALPLLWGALAGVAAALLVILWTLRSLRALSARALLAGSQEGDEPRRGTRRGLYWGAGAGVTALAVLLAALVGGLSDTAGFLGSGALLLVALVSFQSLLLARRRRAHVPRAGTGGMIQMGFRNASWRPGRSLLCIALVASATFILVAVESFRHPEGAGSLDPQSGTGGFPLLAESLLPLPYDPNTDSGRDYMALAADDVSTLQNIRFLSFRLRPGEDASCLNLYQPRNPRVLGVPLALIESGRFTFQTSLAESAAEAQNPWILLNKELADGAVPTIVDATTMTYVLHLSLGGDFVLKRSGEEPIRFRIVAVLADSIFQSELLISEQNFLRFFPQVQGFQFFLLEAPPAAAADIAGLLEDRLADSGFDVSRSRDRLETFHRVENTYLSTFQALGGLGLLLGTVGLGAVLLRNVLERRPQLALLRAVGYRQTNLTLLVVAENALLLLLGLVSGVISSLLAITPALAQRGGGPAVGSLALLFVVVFGAGLAASVLAVLAVVRTPLLPALRAE